MTMRLLLLLATAYLASCSPIPTVQERETGTNALAGTSGWQAQRIAAGVFELMSYVPTSIRQADALTIYIEGDGLAWVTSSMSSADPTPSDPVALRLALAQPGGNAAYLARPCQYVDAVASRCSSRYWTHARFAPEVISASGLALDALKKQFGARRLTLVGYSGGGAVAALLAARRSDVERLVTVAGNLDHHAWTEQRFIPPLTGSLNPADEIDALRRIPQWHFVGARDTLITPQSVQAFADKFPRGQQPQVRIEADFDHRCCWADAWPRLWKSLPGE